MFKIKAVKYVTFYVITVLNKNISVYGEWELGDCSVTCGEGTREDKRKCLQGSCDQNLLTRTEKCTNNICQGWLNLIMWSEIKTFEFN